MRQQLLDAIYAGQPFRTVLRDLDLTPNRVWGLTSTDQEWSEKLGAAARPRCPEFLGVSEHQYARGAHARVLRGLL